MSHPVRGAGQTVQTSAQRGGGKTKMARLDVLGGSFGGGEALMLGHATVDTGNIHSI